MQGTCLNCETAYSGKYCPNCGQKKDTHRFSFATIIHDIPHSVFHIDKGLFFTFLVLLYKPGKAIKDYIAGKRVNYFQPFAYLFLLSAASSFVAHKAAMYEPTPVDITHRLLNLRVAVFFAHYPALIFCTILPFISFWSWIFNKNTGYNYWEHIVLNTYLIAQFNVFFIIRSITGIVTNNPSHSVTLLIIVFMGYMVFAYLQFFKNKTSLANVLTNTTMFILIALTLITCLSITGFMTPWWK